MFTVDPPSDYYTVTVVNVTKSLERVRVSRCQGFLTTDFCPFGSLRFRLNIVVVVRGRVRGTCEDRGQSDQLTLQ